MRIVAALCGDGLLRHDEPITAAGQRRSALAAARALAGLAREHELAVVHGNAPHVALLAPQAQPRGGPGPAGPGARAEELVGALIEQELDDLLGHQKPCVGLLTQVEVDLGDPAFTHPARLVGPAYRQDEAALLARERGWSLRPDGDHWRRAVPAPLPRRIIDLRALDLLLACGAVVLCGGGGGVPTAVAAGGEPVGVEAVIDMERTGALLAEGLGADAYLLLGDADAVYERWGTPAQRALRHCGPEALLAFKFPAGAMGLRVEAACAFAAATGRRAVIAALPQAAEAARGEAGTVVSREFAGVSYYG